MFLLPLHTIFAKLNDIKKSDQILVTMGPTRRLLAISHQPGRLVSPGRSWSSYVSGLIYQIYTNILYVLEYKSRMKITLGWWLQVGLQNWAGKHEVKCPKPSQMQPMSSTAQQFHSFSGLPPPSHRTNRD
jgi:hypothetical protein